MGRSLALKAGSSPVPRGPGFGPSRGLTPGLTAGASIARRLLAGIDRRGITDKRAARDAGTHPSTFKRLRAGLTTRIDCALVASLARTDRAWLDEIFGPPLDDNGQPTFAARAASAGSPIVVSAHVDMPPGWAVLAPALAVPDPRHVLTQAGLLDRAAIYRVEPHAVTTLWLGATLRTEADALGRTLAQRKDRAFADALERQIRATTAPTVTRFVDVVTAGVRATWRRLAVPSGTGLVTHIVHFEKIEELG